MVTLASVLLGSAGAWRWASSVARGIAADEWGRLATGTGAWLLLLLPGSDSSGASTTGGRTLSSGLATKSRTLTTGLATHSSTLAASLASHGRALASGLTTHSGTATASLASHSGALAAHGSALTTGLSAHGRAATTSLSAHGATLAGLLGTGTHGGSLLCTLLLSAHGRALALAVRLTVPVSLALKRALGGHRRALVAASLLLLRLLRLLLLGGLLLLLLRRRRAHLGVGGNASLAKVAAEALRDLDARLSQGSGTCGAPVVAGISSADAARAVRRVRGTVHVGRACAATGAEASAISGWTARSRSGCALARKNEK